MTDSNQLTIPKLRKISRNQTRGRVFQNEPILLMTTRFYYRSRP